jgi:DNA-binding transcriptional ArsR family regulator
MPTTHSRRTLDERLAKALSHPVRQRILERLNEGVASPNELAKELDEPLGNVSYHVRILRDYDCVELVKTRQRRGAVEHYYRATARPWLDDRQWGQLPLAIRRKTMGRTVTEILEDASKSSQHGGFDHPKTHVSKTLLELDDRGWNEVVTLLGATLDRALGIQAEAAARRAQSTTNGKEPINTELAVLHFRRLGDAGESPPRRPRRKSG